MQLNHIDRFIILWIIAKIQKININPLPFEISLPPTSGLNHWFRAQNIKKTLFDEY